MAIQSSDVEAMSKQQPQASIKYIIDQADGGMVLSIVPVHDDDTGKECGLTIVGCATGAGKMNTEVQAIQHYLVTVARALIMTMGGHFDEKTVLSVKDVIIQSNEYLLEVCDAATQGNTHIQDLSS